MSETEVFTASLARSDNKNSDVYDEAEMTKSARLKRVKVLALRSLVLVAIIGGWQLASGTIIDAFFISTPTEIVSRIVTWITDGTLAESLLFTMQAMLLGFAIGAVAGILLGLILGRADMLANVLDPFILAVYSLPKVALVPLFLLWFGIGLKTNTAIAALTVFFLVFFNTYSGARTVDQDLIDVVRLMGGTRRQVFRTVVVPSAMVWIFTGLRLAVPYALIGAIVGEIVASDRGLGFLIRRSAGFFDTAGVFAALAVLMIVSGGLNALVNKLESRTSRWRALPQ